jgi:hypothetical protein
VIGECQELIGVVTRGMNWLTLLVVATFAHPHP